MEPKKKGKVILCLPTYPLKPHPATLESIKNEVPLLEAAGWQHGIVSEIGCPYISAARATMLRKALDAKADVVFFLDSDVSWEPGALLKVIETEGDVVAGNYRFKKGDPDDFEGCGERRDGTDAWYMGGYLAGLFQRPQVRESDGALKMDGVPAGFLKVTRAAVNLFMEKFPELCYGERSAPHVDLFNHGAHKGVWWGEDFAFCRRWREECGGEIWCVPDIGVHHNSGDGASSAGDAKCFRGNYHQYLLNCPGGSESDSPVSPTDLVAQVKAKAGGKL
jgi:hypothetical protein